MSKTNTTVIPSWRKNLVERLKAAARTFARGQQRFVAIEGVEALIQGRETLAPHTEEAKGLTSHVEATKKELDKLEGDIMAALAGGAKVPEDSKWNLDLGSEAKRNQWTNEGVERLLEHLAAGMIELSTMGPVSPGDVRDLCNYTKCLELAAKSGWIGGAKRVLLITERPQTQVAQAGTKPAFKGL